MERFAPDIVNTVRRFPFPVLLFALATIVLVGLTSSLLNEIEETGTRLALGLATGAVFALAGRLFAESRPDRKLTAFILQYAVPVAVIAALQLRSFEFLMPFMLLPISILWLSVAAFTKIGEGEERIDIQNRFWWLNHRAATTAVIALAGFLVVALGLVSIERSMALLFGISTSTIFYEYVLPATAMFLTPLYWLSTIPALDDYRAGELDEPDFLSRAIGFLGQFVLVPLLLVYALILLAYAAQIIFTRTIPEGTLGWMVLGFTITGAVNWLLLHPGFMHQRRLVRVFRTYWFWLTIIPIGLFALGVWLRVDAYGLTAERILLIAGGLWAGLLTLTFLIHRFADIRSIPAIAAFILVIVSVGPWNFENAALWNQASRLQAAIDAANPTSDQASPDWQPEDIEKASGAFRYLRNNEGQEILRKILADNGLDTEDWDGSAIKLAEILGFPGEAIGEFTPYIYLNSTSAIEPLDMSATPILMGRIDLWKVTPVVLGAWEFKAEGNDLVVMQDQVEIARANVGEWVSRQDIDANTIIDPRIILTTPERAMVLLVIDMSTDRGIEAELSNISALLFVSEAP